MNDIQKTALTLINDNGGKYDFSELINSIRALEHVNYKKVVDELQKLLQLKFITVYFPQPLQSAKQSVVLTGAGAEQHRKNIKSQEVRTIDDMDRAIVLNPGSSHEITLSDYIDHKIKEALNNLRLSVDTYPKSNYVGDNGNGSMYQDSTVVKIQLLADIADEEYLISEIDFETE